MLNPRALTADGGERRPRRLLRGTAILLSLLAHLALFAGLLAFEFQPSRPAEVAPVEVSLLRVPALLDQEPPSPAPSAAPAPAAAAPAPVRRKAVALRPPSVIPVSDRSEADDGVSAEVGEAEIAGAGNADSGPSAHGCELARRVQDALRKDALVQSEVAAIHRSSSGGALMVWNGDWVRSPAEDGKGLAAVREAITWEVASAPPACRTEPVHGLVVLSVKDGAALPRLALGAGEWRWADLLFARGARPSGNP